MQFTISLQENQFKIYHSGIPLFSQMCLTVATQRNGCCALFPETIHTEQNMTEVVFASNDRVAAAKLVFTQYDGVLQCRVEMATVKDHTRYNYYFASNDSIRLHFRFARQMDGNYITEASTKQWFQTPSFSRDLTALPSQTQDIHIRSGKEHIHWLPLVGDDFRTEFKDDYLSASVGCGGVTEISAYLFTLAIGTDPFEVIRQNFRAARATGAISVPLREERVLPEMFQKFGWCTWDAFYQEPTSQKLFQKLDELKALGIKLGYVLIDDGWSQVKDNSLWAFEEDFEKFPEGLAACIKRIKTEYDIPYVGVWQAFDGYWKGVHPNGPVAREMGDTLEACPNGLLIPAPDADRNFAFWDRWHTYLAKAGVDFVKVDNQTTYSYYIDEVCKNVAGVRAAHEGLERSVFKHFDGRLINCMGMGIYDQLTRPRSALNRNSNDFLPNLENGFAIHLRTNVYNVPVHSQIMYCDYDMWWSRHESAKASAVLRAISGGPIYISDPIEGTETTYLAPLYEADGSFPKLDSYGMPTYDCFYTDCEAAGVPQKVFNRAGDCFAVAAFGISDEGAKGELTLDDIPGIDACDYLAVEFFSGERCVLTHNGHIELTLAKHDVALYNLYPIRNGKAEVGEGTMYMGCATKQKQTVQIG